MTPIVNKIMEMLATCEDLPSKSFKVMVRGGELDSLLGLSSKVEASLGKEAQSQLRVAKLSKQYALPAESRDATAQFDKVLAKDDEVRTCVVSLVEVTAASASDTTWVDKEKLEGMSTSLRNSLQITMEGLTERLSSRKVTLKDLCNVLQVLADATKVGDSVQALPILDRMADENDTLKSRVESAAKG